MESPSLYKILNTPFPSPALFMLLVGIQKEKEMMNRAFRLPLWLLTIVTMSATIISSCSKEKSFENGTIPGDLRFVEYNLAPADSSGISGTILISENKDSSFNIQVKFSPSVQDTVHILHLHNGSTTAPGSIALELQPATGNGSIVESTTGNISQLIGPDGTSVKTTYSDMLNFAGYVDVHFSATNTNVVAQGRVGN